MAQAGPSTSRQQLVCAVCQEVYRSPRFLPNCYHSFCLHCLEGMARTHGPTFPCPTCRTVVRVPQGGVQGFKVNFYISEEDLERERNQATRPMCGTHPAEELIFFCKPCLQPICMRCKLTKHESHPTEDLADTADHCKKKLRSSKKRLERSIRRLTKASALSMDNRREAKEKAGLLEGQINEQCDSIVAMVTTQRDLALRDLRALVSAVDNDLSAHVATVQRHLDSLIQLQQQVSLAIDGNHNDAEVVGVEREVREGEGSVREGEGEGGDVGVASTMRPGLRGDVHGVLRLEDLPKVFGTPVCLHLPNVFGTPVCLHLPSAAPREEIIPVFRCAEIKGCREVHALQRIASLDIAIAYGGRAPAYEDETVIKVNINGGVQKKAGTPVKRKVSFMGLNRFPFDLFDSIAKDPLAICSKSRTDTRVVLVNHPPKAIHRTHGVGRGEIEKEIAFDLEDAGTPLAIDTDVHQRLLIVLSEDVSPAASTDHAIATSPLLGLGHTAPKRRTVQMYLSSHSKPVSRYTPPQQPFLASDVCFWHGLKSPNPPFLLISDMATDSVHLVSVEDDQFRFLRYLASGSPHILRPTALDVAFGEVLIGCENGWVLLCRSILRAYDDDSEEEDMEEDKEEEEEEEEGGSADGSDQLQVENGSESTISAT